MPPDLEINQISKSIGRIGARIGTAKPCDAGEINQMAKSTGRIGARIDTAKSRDPGEIYQNYESESRIATRTETAPARAAEFSQMLYSNPRIGSEDQNGHGGGDPRNPIHQSATCL